MPDKSRIESSQTSSTSWAIYDTLTRTPKLRRMGEHIGTIRKKEDGLYYASGDGAMFAPGFDGQTTFSEALQSFIGHD